MPYQNLIRLRKQIICDVLNWKSTENLIEEHREKFGKLTIAGIEFWFDGFKSKFQNTNNFLVTEELKRIASETWFTPENVLRFLILIDVIREKSIEESHSSLCDILGYTNIHELEHDFWYQRFKNGSRSFNYPPKFLDLPVDIIQRFVDKLDIKEQQLLRGVCRDLRSLIDNRRPPLSHIEFSSSFSGTIITFDEKRVTYCDYKDFDKLYGETIISETNFNDRAISDLARFLKNPKIRLDSFSFATDSPTKFCPEFLEILPENHKIHVKNLHFYGHSNYKFCLELLKSVEPGTLEIINFKDREIAKHGEFLKGLVELEQWKLAKRVALEQHPILFNIEHFSHFETFSVRVEELSVKVIKKIRDVLKKSPNFKHCWLTAGSKLSVDDIIEDLNLKDTLVIDGNGNAIVLPCDDHFRFILDTHKICIKKIPNQLLLTF